MSVDAPSTRIWGWIGWALKVALLLALAYYVGLNAPGVLVIATVVLTVSAVGGILIGIFTWKLKSALMCALTCLVLLPLAFSALFSPMLALYSLFADLAPEWSAYINDHLKYIGPVPLPVADALACLSAAVGVPALAIVIWREQRLMSEKRRQIENLPTSRVQGAALGLVELSGQYQFTAEPLKPGDTPHTWRPDFSKHMFFLHDATGHIRIDPTQEMSFSGMLTSLFQLGLPDIALSRGQLVSGDRMLVVGTLEANPAAPPEATGPDALIVRRRTEAKKSFFEGLNDLAWKLLGGGSRNHGYQELFFIADGDEPAVRKRLKQIQRSSLFRSLVLLALCLWLLASRLDRLLPRGTTLEDPAYYTEEADLHWLLAHAENKHPDYRAFARGELKGRSTELKPALWTAFVLNQLTSPHADSRAWASSRAADLPVNASHARFTHPLIKAVDRNDAAALASMDVLSRIAAPKQEVIACLIAWSKHPDPAMRGKALQSMKRFGPETLEFIPALAWCLGDADSEVRKAATEVLKTYRTAALPALLAAAATGNATAQTEAVPLVVVAEKDPARRTAFLQQMLAPGPGSRQIAALYAISWIEPALIALTPEVARLLAETDKDLRRQTLLTLEKLALDQLTETDWQRVQDSLTGADRRTRRTAWRLLRASPLDQEAVGDILLKITHSPDHELAIDALVSLSESEHPAVRSRAVARLIECLAVEELRDTAVAQLGEMGPDAAAAVPTLVAKVLNKDTPSRSRLIVALGGIGSVEGLLACLDPRNDTYRGYVFEELGRLGARAAPALPLMVKELRATELQPEERAILNALKEIGPAARSVLPEVEAIVGQWTEGSHAWDSAAQALMQMRRPVRAADWQNQPAVPPLIQFDFEKTLLAENQQFSLTEDGPAVEWREGLPGQAVHLAGATRLTGTLPTELPCPQGYTIELFTWFDRAKRAAKQDYVLFDSELCQIYTDGAKELLVDVYADKGSTFTTFHYPLTNAGVWRHLAVVWDPFERKLSLYHDGKAVDSTGDWRYSVTLDPPPKHLDFSAPAQTLKTVAVGGIRAKSAYTWRKNWIGRVDSLKIYDSPRTAEQIAKAARGGK